MNRVKALFRKMQLVASMTEFRMVSVLPLFSKQDRGDLFKRKLAIWCPALRMLDSDMMLLGLMLASSKDSIWWLPLYHTKHNLRIWPMRTENN
jgi:hypothetical protein